MEAPRTNCGQQPYEHIDVKMYFDTLLANEIQTHRIDAVVY